MDITKQFKIKISKIYKIYLSKKKKKKNFHKL